MEITKLKAAIIYGRDSVDQTDKDGSMEEFLRESEDAPHYFYIKDFLEDHMKDKEAVQNAKLKNDANSIFYELQSLGHICFAENTSYTDCPTGIVYMPNQITDKQIDSLKQFQQALLNENYTITLFFHLFRTEDGVISGYQKQGNASILDSFCQKQLNTELDER